MEGATATVAATSNDIACTGVVVVLDHGPVCGQGAGGNTWPAAAVGLPESDGWHNANNVAAVKGIDHDLCTRKHGRPPWSASPLVPANNEDIGNSTIAIGAVVNALDLRAPGPTAAAGLTNVSTMMDGEGDDGWNAQEQQIARCQQRRAYENMGGHLSCHKIFSSCVFSEGQMSIE